MTDIVNYSVLDILVIFSSQCLIQIPARLCWANNVVSTLDNDDREMLDLVSFLDQLTISHPATVDEEMALNACES
jgi:hypothetical protein